MSNLFFEKKSYSLPLGMDKKIGNFITANRRLYDNKSHVVRCALIAFFRDQEKKTQVKE